MSGLSIFQQCICSDQEPQKNVRNKPMSQQSLEILFLGTQKVGKTSLIHAYEQYGKTDSCFINRDIINKRKSTGTKKYYQDNEKLADLQKIPKQVIEIQNQSDINQQITQQQHIIHLQGIQNEDPKIIKITEQSLDTTNKQEQNFKQIIEEKKFNLITLIFSFNDKNSIQSSFKFLENFIQYYQKDIKLEKLEQNPVPIQVIGIKYKQNNQNQQQQSNELQQNIQENLFHLIFEQKGNLTIEYKEINLEFENEGELKDLFKNIEILAQTHLRQQDLQENRSNYSMSFMLSEALVMKENKIEQNSMTRNSYKNTQLFQSSFNQAAMQESADQQ